LFWGPERASGNGITHLSSSFNYGVANCDWDFVRPAVRGSVVEVCRLRAGAQPIKYRLFYTLGLSSHRNAVIRIVHNAAAP